MMTASLRVSETAQEAAQTADAARRAETIQTADAALRAETIQTADALDPANTFEAESAYEFIADCPANIHRIPAFQDNYLWMIASPEGAECWVVDPGDALALIEASVALRLRIRGVLLTHHHSDHQGGVEDLMDHALQAGTKLEVVGPVDERIHACAVRVGEGNWVDLGFAACQVLAVPGHTRSHLAYYFPNWAVLFCGDTLFAAGCGRLFEGTPEQMLDSLARLAGLPPHTRICCAHEYTLSNLRFAAATYPQHAAIARRLTEAERARSASVATVPSTIEAELRTNPFLLGLVPQSRGVPFIKDHGVRVARFADLRARKNSFRG